MRIAVVQQAAGMADLTLLRAYTREVEQSNTNGHQQSSRLQWNANPTQGFHATFDGVAME
jgi:hypothetical protein